MGRAGVGGRGGTPLSPSERRDAYGNDTAMAGPRGPLAGYTGAAPAADPRHQNGGTTGSLIST